MNVQNKRDVVLVGHAHCGKTSLTESLLFFSGATSRKGDVMAGNSISDYNDDERERKISINSSLLQLTYKEHQIQLLDTPGYLDFFGETVASLRAADGAVVVIDAIDGVGVGTEEVWQRMVDQKMPAIFFINKIDKSEAHVDETLADIRAQLTPKAQIIDFDSSDFIEAVAESDDVLLEKYLETGTLSQSEIKGALHQAVLDGNFFPVILGDAIADKGLEELLEGIVAYLPSPLEHAALCVEDSKSHEKSTLEPSEDGPFAGLVFKSMFDSHLGHISLMRIFSGTLKANSDFYNVNRSSKEHIGAISMLQGKEQKSVATATCGDIVALTKLKNAHVSDTITNDKGNVLFSPIQFPEPSISASIKPKTRADEEKIAVSLNRLCEEDHTFRVNRNAETKELIISGIGDLHLKVMLERMKKRYHVEVELGKPKVSFRETITKPARARFKYKKQSGGRGQYGDVELSIEPLPQDGENFIFENKIFGGSIPRNYVPSVEKGVRQTINAGVLAGFHVDHIKVAVVDGSYHAVDSSDMAFQIAAAHALKDAIMEAGPTLLEPIMEVAIVVTDEYMGPISGDISSRRGRIIGTEVRGRKEVIRATVPLSELSSYATDLRSMTGGRGSYSMKMSHYEQAPTKITNVAIEEFKK
ncbi:elongation factor G [Candidatus Omnitrophota bacterium]